MSRGYFPAWIPALLLCACALTAASAGGSETGIEWTKDIATAMQLSAKDGRPVITYFTFDT